MKIINSYYKILIVDTSRNNIISLESVLRDHDFNVIKAQTGTDALALIRSEKPDLILLEIQLPDMSGFDICSYVRIKSDLKHIPVIFLTISTDTESIIKSIKVGGSDYIVKPFSWEVLLERIRHQLSLVVAKSLIIKKNTELRNTITSRDKMYSIVAHDLRSPIGTIKMILNFLSENNFETIGQDAYFKMIRDINYISEDVFTLLDNLLKWTKNQTGNMKPIFQEMDLSEVLFGSYELFQKICSVKKITVELKSIPDAIVCVDIEMIKSCIRNLMSNAYKFSYENSKIIVSLSEENENWIISVQDFGCGMDEESAQKLLNTDTHFSTQGTAHESGSGLGLLLVKELVNKNRGQLWFKTKKDTGSTFFISLPKSKSKLKKQ